MFVTSRFVSPNAVRESHSGTCAPIDAHMCITGLSGVPVMPNGITLGLWLWTTAWTSATRFVDRAVNEALRVRLAAARLDRRAVERELHEVVDLDAFRRARARQDVAIGELRDGGG